MPLDCSVEAHGLQPQQSCPHNDFHWMLSPPETYTEAFCVTFGTENVLTRLTKGQRSNGKKYACVSEFLPVLKQLKTKSNKQISRTEAVLGFNCQNEQFSLFTRSGKETPRRDDPLQTEMTHSKSPALLLSLTAISCLCPLNPVQWMHRAVLCGQLASFHSTPAPLQRPDH